MIIDILFWAMKFRPPTPPNLFLVAQDISEASESELVSVLRFLKSKGFNVVLVAQHVDIVDVADLQGAVSSVWPLTDLLQGLLAR